MKYKVLIWSVPLILSTIGWYINSQLFNTYARTKGLEKTLRIFDSIRRGGSFSLGMMGMCILSSWLLPALLLDKIDEQGQIFLSGNMLMSIIAIVVISIIGILIMAVNLSSEKFKYSKFFTPKGEIVKVYTASKVKIVKMMILPVVTVVCTIAVSLSVKVPVWLLYIIFLCIIHVLNQIALKIIVKKDGIVIYSLFKFETTWKSTAEIACYNFASYGFIKRAAIDIKFGSDEWPTNKQWFIEGLNNHEELMESLEGRNFNLYHGKKARKSM